MKKTIACLTALCLILSLIGGLAFAEGGYQVLVTDADGSPVGGVMVQFCSESECMTGKTDENGVADFDQPAGAYTVHILKAPEGFAADDREYAAPEEPGRMTVVLLAEEDVLDVSDLGFKFYTPLSYLQAESFPQWYGGFADDGFFWADVDYYAVPVDQFDAYVDYYYSYYDALDAGEEPPAPPVASWMSGKEHATLFHIYGINGGRGEEELNELIRYYCYPGDEGFAWLEETCVRGDTRFFVGQDARSEEKLADFREGMGDLFEEFLLLSDKDSFLAALSYSEPKWPVELSVGDVIAFETTDLDGNYVNSAELFAQSKVTMINLWATWCGPCVGELPELGVMAEEFAAQGCRIVGLCHDAREPGMTETARSLLNDAGAGYLNLIAPDNADELLCISAFPTSYFVDSEGRLLVEPIVGAYPAGYRTALAEALALVG